MKVALRKSHEESLQQRLALMEGEMKLVPSGLDPLEAGRADGRCLKICFLTKCYRDSPNGVT